MNNKVISLKREIKDDYNYRESLKTLRTNIQFCGSNIRTIMFTSALPDEWYHLTALLQLSDHIPEQFLT